MIKKIITFFSPTPQEELDASTLDILARPSVAIHSGEGAPGRNHLAMWIPAFEAAGIPFCVIVRTRALYNFCQTCFPHVSCVRAGNPQIVENVLDLLANLRVVFYSSNTGNNIHLLRFNHLTHIYLGHGDEVASQDINKFMRVYDQIWTSGQAHIDRFSMSPFCTDGMTFSRIGRPAGPVRSGNNDSPAHPGVLYLPVWDEAGAKNPLSSLPLAPALLAETLSLTQGWGGILPYAKMFTQPAALAQAQTSLYRSLQKRNLHVITYSQETQVRCLAGRADIFICDISSFITDCLLEDKPIFTYAPDGYKDHFAPCNIDVQYFTYTFSSSEEFLHKLKSVLSGNDELSKQRNEAISYFIEYKNAFEKQLVTNIRNLQEQC